MGAMFADAPYEVAADGRKLVIDVLTPTDGQRFADDVAAMHPWSTYGYPASALASFLASSEPGAPRLALHLDGSIIGAAVIRTAWLRGPYLQFLALLPAAQGRGVGTAFLGWMEREARAAEERNLWVAASEINGDAIRFYERHGFRRVADLDGLVHDDRTEILFRKRLGR
jgi:diamine N-acetyltransferase